VLEVSNATGKTRVRVDFESPLTVSPGSFPCGLQLRGQVHLPCVLLLPAELKAVSLSKELSRTCG